MSQIFIFSVQLIGHLRNLCLEGMEYCALMLGTFYSLVVVTTNFIVYIFITKALIVSSLGYKI